jgi:hypothetical protein
LPSQNLVVKELRYQNLENKGLRKLLCVLAHRGSHSDDRAIQPVDARSDVTMGLWKTVRTVAFLLRRIDTTEVVHFPVRRFYSYRGNRCDAREQQVGWKSSERARKAGSSLPLRGGSE